MTPDRTRARRRHQLVTGTPFLVTVAVLVVLFVAYTLAGFFLLPRLIATHVPRYAQEQLARRAEIGEVRFNPLLFKLEIKHFRLQEADGRPLLGFERLFVDFELSSLVRRAWTFAEIQLERPRVDVALSRDGRLNVAELLDALPRGETAEPREPTPPRRMLLQHAVIRAGAASFTDLSRSTPQTATLEPIDVELRDITTVPERRGPYAIAATLAGGGVIGWQGEVSLVPLGSTGRLGILGFPLATAWRFVQDDLALAEPAGRLDADVRYEFAYRDGVASAKVRGVDATLAGLVLTRRGDTAPLLTLERVRMTGAHGDVVARELTVPEISLSRGRVAAAVARDGVLDWQILPVTPPDGAARPADGGAPSPSPDPAPADGAARPWRLAVERVRVEELAMAFVDRSRAAALAVEVGELTLGLSARLEGAPSGLAGIVEGLELTLARVGVRDAAAAGAPVVTLDEIAVEGGRIDLAAQRVALSKIAVKGGSTSVVRAADGSLPLTAMLAPAQPPPPAPALAATRARPAAPAAKPWAVALESFDLAGHRVAIADRSVSPAGALGIEQIRISGRDLRSDGTKPFPFDASFRVQQGGRFTVKGQIAPDLRAADATLALAQLALAPAQPYVAQHAAVVLRTGDVSTRGRLRYRAGRERATLTYSGSADVDRLLVVEAATGDPVVSWKSLHAAGLRFGLAPDRLEIDEVRVAGLDGRLVIFEDKTLNLARLMKPAGAPAGPEPTGAATDGAPAGNSGDAAAGFPVAVERVRVDDSSMSFADLSLVLPFATRVHALTGVVAGLGSDAASRATVKLDGQVDEYGLVRVAGALASFHPKVFTDIAVVFRNVPMSTLTPYSVTFAGRRIRSGTMDLDLEYKIERSALLGENKVVLRQLQLGERVESPGAMRLPLDLAIAILSDAEGRIDIALPVRGNVDSPEFSYGHLIWQAIVTVVTRIVTSPFRALAGLVGGDGESLQAVAFEAGSDTVRPPEREKLQRVVELLGKRPRLKLTVHGGYETQVDGEALRSLTVRRDLAQRLDVSLKPGEDPGPVALDQARTQRALESLLSERAGEKAIEQVQATYEKSTGTKAQRVNPVLALVGRGSPDRPFYEAVFRRLVELAPLTEAEVAALGQRRGEAVARALRERAGTAAARVEVGAAEAAAAAEQKAVPTRLELGVAEP